MMLNQIEKRSVLVRDFQVEHMLCSGAQVFVESLNVLIEESRQISATSAMER
jgi:hypothetical protein